MLLAINTATKATSIALLQEKHLVAEKSWSADRDEAAKTLPEILHMLGKQKKSFSDLKKLLVVNGPGPFSGVRVGITIVNTLALSLNLKVFAMDTFELMHFRVGKTPLLVFLPAGNSHLGVRAYEIPFPGTILGSSAQIVAQLNQLKNEPISYVGEISDSDHDYFKKHTSWQKLSDRKLLSFGQAVNSLDLATKQPLHTAMPEYLLPPNITRSRKIGSLGG